MSYLSLENITKSYDNKNLVIKNLSLEIFEDEFLVLVGPSGCGKTTTLRMIAGLEDVTSGKLYLNSKLQNEEDPSKRDLSFVFQNYALLPNLTVFENIEFGLSQLKLSKLEKYRLIGEIADKLSLKHKLGNYPSQLSGGERQRVALGRALVDGRKLVLFDEPLSNLDALLRSGMRKELIEYKRNFGVTAVYVTHDQIEAMSLASRIVLLMDGKIIQVGTPNQMYYDPSHLKTIEFIGSNEANILFGHISDNTFIKDQLKLKLPKEQLEKLKDYNEVYLVIRPEDVIVSNEKRPGYLEANIIFSENFGKDQLVHLNVDGEQIRVVVHSDFNLKEKLYISIEQHICYFDKEEKRIDFDAVDEIYLDFEMNTHEEIQVKKELENYSITLKQTKDTKAKLEKNTDKSYLLTIKSKKYTLNRVSEVFKYIRYQNKR